MSPLRGPLRGGRGGLALAFARAVVGVVEALALEVHRRRVQHALDRHAGVGVVVSVSSLKDCWISNVVPSGRLYS